MPYYIFRGGYIKKRLFFLLLLAVLIYPFAAAHAQMRHKFDLPFPVTKETDVRYIEVTAFYDSDFVISLEANPATGHVWREYQRLPQGITFVSSTFKAKAAAGGPFDTPGIERCRYHTSTKHYGDVTGHTHIILKYERPWEHKPAAYAVCCVNIYVNNPYESKFWVTMSAMHRFHRRPWVLLFFGTRFERAEVMIDLYKNKPRIFWLLNLLHLCLVFIVVHVSRAKEKDYWSLCKDSPAGFILVSFLLALWLIIASWLLRLLEMAAWGLA